MRTIKLSRGTSTIVDDKWYNYLSQWKWCVSSWGYAIRSGGKGEKRTICMHRIIAKTPKDKATDHINGDKLDNREANLRVCDDAQNLRNRMKTRKKRLSIYKGVSQFTTKRHKKYYWTAQIGKDNKGYRIGYFDKERHAALAYDLWAIELYGEFAKLNFDVVCSSAPTPNP